MAVVVRMNSYNTAHKFRDFCCGPGDQLALEALRGLPPSRRKPEQS